MSYVGHLPYKQTRLALNHPLANGVSIVSGHGTYTTGSLDRELAFFMNDEWVSIDIPEFAQYSSVGTMSVYAYVPYRELLAFLTKYAVHNDFMHKPL